LQWPSKEALKRQPKLGVDYRLLVDGTPEEILADLRKTVCPGRAEYSGF
jgi:hypothetical protein